MFATILRRWRLVTPLVLAVLAISIVSGGMLMPASAHQIAFHFFGRAYALNDNQPIPDTACDTGFLPLTGQVSLDTGACFGAAGPGQPGSGVTGGVTGTGLGTPGSTFGRMFTIYADDSVASTHGVISGKVVATANLEGGINVCISQVACNLLYITPGVNSLSRGCQLAVVTVTKPYDGDTNDGKTIAFVPTVFCADDVEETAFAFCHRHSDGSTQASVGATMPQFNTPAFDEDGQFFYLGDSNGNAGIGLVNESFTVSGSRAGLGILVTLNEQLPFVDGDLGAISATAVHIVVTNQVDLVKADFYIAHVFAGIHCAKHLGTDQNVGTLVDD
jgi:hypothetical protein